ncbi:MAG: hypothetical protein LBI67_12020 [Treponema sp.]|jgi:hypothetical protein|nr:hypothetical protein [Treponema sp.]
MQFIYDQLNSLGKATLASDSAFPNVIDLEDADISRMTVDVKRSGAAAAGGTGITVSVAGSNDSAFGTSETLGSRTIAETCMAEESNETKAPAKAKAWKAKRNCVFESRYVREGEIVYAENMTNPHFEAAGGKEK